MNEVDSRIQPVTIALWGIIVLVYILIIRVPFNHAYLDFGDGNYQYISWRMTEGVSLYTDILSPQPPFHLWTGAALVKLSDWLGGEPLYWFRWFTLLLRIATSALVGLIAVRLFRSQGRALLASVILLILPEGYRWSQGYQSEHLELFLLCLSLLLTLYGKPWQRNLSPLLAVGAMWTNMSALPFSILLILLAVFRNPISWTPILTAILSLVGLVGVSIGLYGDAYLQNVWSNQVASIPSNPQVWIDSIVTEGTTIIDHEGLFILLALAGIWRFIQGRDSDGRYGTLERSLIGLWGIASVGSAIYVVKGGTVDYIFMLAEPALALFAASAIVTVFSPHQSEVSDEGGTGTLGELGLGVCRILLMVGLFVLLMWKPYAFIYSYRNQAGTGVDLRDQSQGRLIEYSDVEVNTILRLIDHYTEEGDTIWAPPFFAALTEHPVAEDLSETYLWYVRWQQNLFAKQPDPEVDSMIEGMTASLEKTKLPLLLINRRTGQWGHLLIPDGALRLPSRDGGSEVRLLRDLDPRLQKLQSALEQNYHLLLSGPGSEEKLHFQGWNEGIEVWVPKDVDRLPPSWVRVGFGG
ncbi:MAG: hypothetical protein H6751_09110 [Candidatus Omnitrophica bacterium]|nr:hypothetical protein [Candidatus Omnitrophota bacterium]